MAASIRFLPNLLGRAAEHHADPKKLLFDITYRCNLKCKMCDVWRLGGQQNEELSASEIVSIFHEFHSKSELRRVGFVGGEPLLRKDLELIIEQISPHVQTGITTNGMPINRQRARRLVASGVHDIAFSIDGPEDIHNYMRGEGSFTKAVKGLDMILEEKRLQKSSTPELCVRACVSRLNREHLDAMYSFAASKGISFDIQFLEDLKEEMELTRFNGNEIGHHRAIDPHDIKLSRQERAEVIEHFYRVLSKYEKNLSRRLFLKLEKYVKRMNLTMSRFIYRDCVRAREVAIVDPWGNLFPCQYLYNYKYGNIRDQRTAVWYSRDRTSFRNEIAAGSFPVCRQCNRVLNHRRNLPSKLQFAKPIVKRLTGNTWR